MLLLEEADTLWSQYGVSVVLLHGPFWARAMWKMDVQQPEGRNPQSRDYLSSGRLPRYSSGNRNTPPSATLNNEMHVRTLG